MVWKNSSGTTVNTLTYTYESSGNVLTAANPAGTYTMGYDADNRVTSMAGLFGVNLTDGYDAVGNRTGMQDSLGGTTKVVYNADKDRTTTGANGTGMRPMQSQPTYTADKEKSVDTRDDSLSVSTATEVGQADYSYYTNNDMTNISRKMTTARGCPPGPGRSGHHPAARQSIGELLWGTTVASLLP